MSDIDLLLASRDRNLVSWMALRIDGVIYKIKVKPEGQKWANKFVSKYLDKYNCRIQRRR